VEFAISAGVTVLEARTSSSPFQGSNEFRENAPVSLLFDFETDVPNSTFKKFVSKPSVRPMIPLMMFFCSVFIVCRIMLCSPIVSVTFHCVLFVFARFLIWSSRWINGGLLDERLNERVVSLSSCGFHLRKRREIER